MQLAQSVQRSAAHLGIDVEIAHYENPRVESEVHHYNPKHSKLLDLGLKPYYLEDSLVETVLNRVVQFKDRIIPDHIVPRIRWSDGDQGEKVDIVEREPKSEGAVASGD